MSAPRLRMAGVSKTFGRHRVLHDVTLEVAPGEIHALIGQNGSGKSTLAKLLTGLHASDPGARIEVDGAALRLPVHPLQARAHGVAVVHQSLGLVPGMTVLENMRVGRLRAGRLTRRIRWDVERAAAAEVFDRLGRTVPLDAPVQRLGEEDRATVAIARALQDARDGGGLIVFDESTRALSRGSLEHFYAVLDGVVRSGTAALLVTHRLEEVVDACDRVTVLRDGVVVAGGLEVAGRTEADLGQLMLGRVLGEISAGGAPAHRPGPPAVELSGVVSARLRGSGVEVHHGEIVGVTGAGDSGYHELPYVLAGVEPVAAGRLVLEGREVDLAGLTPAAAIDLGVALVPADREGAALALEQTVAENVALPGSSVHGPRLRPLDRRSERARLQPWLDRLELRPNRPDAVVGTLSGGNQQKVVLARWLSRGPALLALHEPTQAVDVGARAVIVHAVRDAAAAGCAVLVASGDENELSMLCDRVLVMREGRVVAELAGPCRPEEIVAAVLAGSQRRRLRSAPAGAGAGAPAAGAAAGVPVPSSPEPRHG